MSSVRSVPAPAEVEQIAYALIAHHAQGNPKSGLKLLNEWNAAHWPPELWYALVRALAVVGTAFLQRLAPAVGRDPVDAALSMVRWAQTPPDQRQG